MNDYRDLAADIVQRARRMGADAADVYIGEGRSLSMEVRLGRVEKIEDAGSTGLGLRVVKNGATAVTSSSDLSPRSIEMLLADTLALVRVTDPDPKSGLPAPGDLGAYEGDLQLHDPSLSEVSVERKLEVAREVEASGREADGRIVNSSGAFWKDGEHRLTLANSHGFVGSYDTSTVAIGVALVAEEGGVKQTDGWWSSGRFLSGLEAPDAVGRKAAARALRKLGARSVATRTVTAVFDPQTAADLLKTVSQAASAAAIHRKSSFLVGKLGERIGSERLTLVDDATLPRGLGSRPFDGEGVRSRVTHVLEAGRLDAFLSDSYHGRQLGLGTTGNASRSVGGPPTVGTSNFYLAAGDRSPEEIIADVQEGFYVTRLYWVGINPVTGDMSRGAEGIWIKGGQLTHAVQEVTLAGNILRMLQNVQAIGNDLEFRSTVCSPTLAISDVVVGGKAA